MSEGLYLGVDVGTGSVRAALFDKAGVRRGLGASEIRTWREGADIVEQSSDDIWRAAVWPQGGPDAPSTPNLRRPRSTAPP